MITNRWPLGPLTLLLAAALTGAETPPESGAAAEHAIAVELDRLQTRSDTLATEMTTLAASIRANRTALYGGKSADGQETFGLVNRVAMQRQALVAIPVDQKESPTYAKLALETVASGERIDELMSAIKLDTVKFTALRDEATELRAQFDRALKRLDALAPPPAADGAK